MPKEAKVEAEKEPNDEVGFVIKNIIPEGFTGAVTVDRLVTEFFNACEPLEKDDVVYVFVDARTGARFCECHILASKLVPLATVDVPLDPDEQPEYRADQEADDQHGDERDVDLEAGAVDQDIARKPADRQAGQPGPEQSS